MNIDLKRLAKNRAHTRYKVALLSPMTGGTYHDVMCGIDYKNKPSDEIFLKYTFLTHGLKKDATTQLINQVLSLNYDLIFCLGSTVSQLTAQITKDKNVNVPVVCVGSGRPATYGLVPSNTSSLSNIAAIDYPPLNVEACVSFFRQAHPTAKTVLLPTHQLQREQQKKLPKGTGGHQAEIITEVEKALKKHCISVIKTKSTSIAGLYEDIQKHISFADAIILLEVSPALSLHEAIGQLCDEKKKPLFACLEQAVQDSAATGYGTTFTSLGEAATEYAQKILFQGISPATLPLLELPDSRHPMINITRATKQGCDVALLKSIVSTTEGTLIK